MPNRQRLIELAKWLGEQHALKEIGEPSEWRQMTWFRTDDVKTNGSAEFGCGTACCAAGHAALKAGGVPVFGVSTCRFDGMGGGTYRVKRWEEMTTDERNAYYASGSTILDGDYSLYVTALDVEMAFKQPDGSYEVMTAEAFARDYLELSDSQAYYLFSGANEFEDMMSAIHGFIRNSTLASSDA